MISARQLVQWFEEHYPQALAEEWDSVGVIAGDWSQEISKVLLSVDITNDVLDEAIAIGADCIVSHHPLILPRHSIVTQPYKFQLIARANLARVFLFNAHTNADNARPGVADALADVLGVQDTEALLPTSPDTVTGTGRIGTMNSSLGQLIEHIRIQIPGSNPRSTHDSAMVVQRVALCPGAGDSLLSQVRETDADVFITSDLRHHPVAEHREAGGCALIDIDHYSSERVWLPVLAQQIQHLVSVELSKISTAAWRSH